MLNTATGCFFSRQTYSAMFMANEVFPIEGTAGDDDQVTALQPGCQLVEITETGWDTGDRLTGVVQFLDTIDGARQQLLDGGEPLPAAPVPSRSEMSKTSFSAWSSTSRGCALRA